LLTCGTSIAAGDLLQKCGQPGRFFPIDLQLSTFPLLLQS
jgi:hypothetical protein